MLDKKVTTYPMPRQTQKQSARWYGHDGNG